METSLSLILACYNEGEHLKESFPRVISVLKKLKKNYEIIFIDDFSQDNTVDIINALIKNNEGTQIRFIKHSKNIGRGGTVSEGMKRAKGDVVGYIDIDLEISPDYIPKFVEKITENKADVVVGKRYYPFSIGRFHRLIASKFYALLVQYALSLPIHDSEAGYKFFNRKKILTVLSKVEDKKWFWDTEIVARSSMAGLRLSEIGVFFKRRQDKTSTVNFVNDIVDYIKSLIHFKRAISQQ